MFGSRLPVSDRAAAWIDERTDWLALHVGRARALAYPVLPDAASFGDRLTGGADDVEVVLGVLCPRFGVDRGGLAVEVVDDGDPAGDARRSHLPVVVETRGAAGETSFRDGAVSISVSSLTFGRPELIATIAHELAHVTLVEGTGSRTDERDHEQLTDLTTVWCGAGIFTANAAVEVRGTGWARSVSTLGYLSEEMFGYALARWALVRDEPDPDWATYLDENPRDHLRQSPRVLTKRASGTTG